MFVRKYTLRDMQAKAIYLVSRDSDLLEMGTIGDCRIMTVQQFEKEIFMKV